jgi:hypothetical protein
MDGGPDADTWQQVAELLEGEVADSDRFCEALLVDLLHALPSLLNDSTVSNSSSEPEIPALPQIFLAAFVNQYARDESQLPAIAKTEGAESVEAGSRGMHQSRMGKSNCATKDTRSLYKGKKLQSVMSKGTGPLQ